MFRTALIALGVTLTVLFARDYWTAYQIQQAVQRVRSAQAEAQRAANVAESRRWRDFYADLKAPPVQSPLAEKYGPMSLDGR